MKSRSFPGLLLPRCAVETSVLEQHRLDASDLQAVLCAVAEVSTVFEVGEYPATVAKALRRLVPCDGAVVGLVDPTVPGTAGISKT